MSHSATHWNKYYETDKDFMIINSSQLSDLILRAQVTPKSKVLDIGCGTGQLTRELFHRGYEVVGIDLSPTAIKKAETSTVFLNKGIAYSVVDLESKVWGLENDSTFSVVFCKLVVAFITDRDRFFKKVSDLLVKDGSFIVLTPTYEVGEPSNPIGVEMHETKALIGKYFEHVTVTNLATLTCYICTK